MCYGCEEINQGATRLCTIGAKKTKREQRDHVSWDAKEILTRCEKILYHRREEN